MKTLSWFADFLVLMLLALFLTPVALAQTPPIVATTTTLTASVCTTAWVCTPRSAIAGEFVQFAVKVNDLNGTPVPSGGEVDWFVDGALVATAHDSLSSTDTANWFTPHLAVGNHAVTAKYLGATTAQFKFAASSSPQVFQVVLAIAPAPVPTPTPTPTPAPAPAPGTDVVFLMPGNCKFTVTARGLAYDCTLVGIGGHLTGLVPLGTTLNATVTPAP
jgi:Bacterial Ig-like domain (group 3)